MRTPHADKSVSSTATALTARSVGILVLLWALAAGNSFAQVPLSKAGSAGLLPADSATNLSPAAGEAEGAAQSVQARLAEARASLAAMGSDSTAWTNAPPEIPVQDLSLRRALYQRLVRLYERQLTWSSELEALKSRKAELVRTAQNWSGFSEPRPYSVLLTDSLREEIQGEMVKVKGGQSALSALDELLEDNRAALTQAEERIRLLNEQLEGATDPAAKLRLSWQREQERLRSRVAGATAATLDIERKLGEERLAQSRVRLDLLHRQLLVADAGAGFSQADLDKALARVEAEVRHRERELAEADARSETARKALDAATQDLARTKDSPGVAPAALAHAAELVDLRRTEVETAETASQVYRVMLESANLERLMWEQRFAAYGSRSAETIRQSERGLQTISRRIGLWKSYYQQQLDVAGSQVALQEARMSQAGADSAPASLARERLASLRERDQVLASAVASIQRSERLVSRWSEGLEDATGQLPFTGRVRNLFSDARGFFNRLWNFELLTAQDTITVDGQLITGKRSVTLGKIVLALLILVVGYWLTGLVSWMVHSIVVKRLKIEHNQSTLIRRWLRVALVLCLVIFILVSVKIPLTVFAFAGGALAIGLGFGMQTLLKNFVSGIIILFERPFRVGDVLDVTGQRGTVTNIGLRASVLQLWDGTETLIPNSTLLESNLTNWTYSNRKVRFSVSVGVAYGSDLRRVSETLAEIAERHGLVEKEPKPQVLLTEFADSAVTFVMRFWVDVSGANAAQVSSDLRLMIAGAFAERNIEIAFPQRDLHLDARQPLPVQVVPVVEQPLSPSRLD